MHPFCWKGRKISRESSDYRNSEQHARPPPGKNSLSVLSRISSSTTSTLTQSTPCDNPPAIHTIIHTTSDYRPTLNSPTIQVALASFMPAAVFLATASSTGFAVAVSQARLKSPLSSPSASQLSTSVSSPLSSTSAMSSTLPESAHMDVQLSAWSFWQLLVGLAGLVVFPQVLMSSLMLKGQATVGVTVLVLVGSYFAFQV